MSSVSSIAAMVDGILGEACRVGATAVHFDPVPLGLIVRRAVDGALEQVLEVPASARADVLAHLKRRAGLDAAGEPGPLRDGRMTLSLPTGEVRLAVTIVAALHGEAASLRLLPAAPCAHRLDGLGLQPEDLARARAALAGAPGLMVLSGPTGSGRHTLLHALLVEADPARRRIASIEAPIRHAIPGVVQLEVNDLEGLTPATLLRACRRLDVDLVGVGELGDQEAVGEVTTTVLGGRHVIATMHAPSAAGVLRRLVDMGQEPWVVADTVSLVLALRLARRLCPRCKVPDGAGFRAAGCDACRRTGHAGRALVVEPLVVTPERRRALREGEPVAPDRSLRDAALALARSGAISVTEALRITPAP